MKYLKYLILLLPGLSILYLVKFSIGGLPTNVFEVLIYLTTIASLLYYPNWRKLTKSEKWAIGLIGLICLISLIISPMKREALGIIKGWIVPAMLVYWMLKNAFSDESDIKMMLKWMVYQGVLVALVALAQSIPVVQTWIVERYPDLGQYLNTGRATGLFNSPNSAAMILVPSLMVVCYIDSCLRPSRSRRIAEADRNDTKNILTNWFDHLLALIILIGLVETRSRGGIIAAVVGLAVLYLWHKRKYVWGIIISILTLLMANPITFSWWVLRNPDNMDIRVSIWQKSWELAQQNWLFGIGLGNFQNKFEEYTLHQINYDEFITPYAVHPHNILLYIWLSFGILGLIGFGYLIFMALRSAIYQKTAWAAIGGVLILTMLIHSMIDMTIFKNDLIIWFVVALVLARAEIKTQN